MKNIFIKYINEETLNKRLIIYLSIILAIVVVIRWFHFIDEYAVNVLFYDHWDLYNYFFESKSLVEVYFAQHGPHRQGIGFILTKYIDQISGWNTKYIAFTIGVLMLFTCFAYLRLKHKLKGKLNALDVVIVLLVLTPTQHGIFTNTPNLSHGAMPAFLLSLLCLSWLIKNDVLRYGSIVLINFLLIYSGFGVFIGFITPVILFIDLYRYKKVKTKLWLIISAVILSFISLGSFFVDYNFGATANPNFKFPHDSPFEYLQFIWILLGRPLNNSVLYFGALISIIFLIIGISSFRNLLKLNLDDSKYIHHKIILTLLTFTFLFVVNTAIGRVSFGVEGAYANRYVPYIIPAYIASYLYFSSLKHKYYHITTAGLLIVGITSCFSLKNEIKQMGMFRDSKINWITEYLNSNKIWQANKTSLYPIHPNAKGTRLKKKLNYLKKNNLNFYLDQEKYINASNVK
ncbi:MAG: hypothetical protein ABJH05_08720 [Fulvivirga sp.]